MCGGNTTTLSSAKLIEIGASICRAIFGHMSTVKPGREPRRQGSMNHTLVNLHTRLDFI